ncbi:hypothetical protein MNBD_GAMMA19-248 [hydrothermal vent metagenome]|uniref:Uncharacterized protein n=1 Tax=hydrothermal vent metagenome TaxID=652676 RepID=A0A3B1B7U2_9ZZZZ
MKIPSELVGLVVLINNNHGILFGWLGRNFYTQNEERYDE